MDPEAPSPDTPYLSAALQAVRMAHAWLAWWEPTMERLAPDRTATLAAQTLDQHAAAFAAAQAALAPIPAPGNLARAAGVPTYLVHGAEDFLFPVALAH